VPNYLLPSSFFGWVEKHMTLLSVLVARIIAVISNAECWHIVTINPLYPAGSGFAYYYRIPKLLASSARRASFSFRLI
jgi:hypothetical protein